MLRYLFPFILPAIAFARLGETEAELLKRFGPPAGRGKESTVAQGKILEFGPTLRFRQGDWSIACTLIDGRSCKENYQKSGEWTEEQFATVLNSNAQGAKWTDISKPGGKKLAREWKRSDGATATWSKHSGITVTHPAYRRAKEVLEAKAKAEAARVPKI